MQNQASKAAFANQSNLIENRPSPYEKIPIRVFSQASQGSREIAKRIAAKIAEKSKLGKPCVLGLATGSTPVGVYAE